jgi:hypothetical protein
MITRSLCGLNGMIRVRVMVFNVTFNNISATCTSWWPCLLVEETGAPRENHTDCNMQIIIWSSAYNTVYIVTGGITVASWNRHFLLRTGYQRVPDTFSLGLFVGTLNSFLM